MSSGLDDDATFGVALPLGAIVLEHVMPRAVCQWNSVSSTTSTAAGLGGLVQRGLGDRRLMMNVRRPMALSGVVAVLTADLARSVL
jgi:hypothetical protein